MARFLVTGALPYSNGKLHMGHIAGAYLPADVYVRYLRLNGHEVRFICGSDDNGVAALKTAREEGRPVEEVTASYRESQRRAFDGLGISFDIYSGTHSFEPVRPDQPDGEKVHELHGRFSQRFFKAAYDNGYFSKRTSTQLYDLEAQQFLPDRFVRGTCPHCGYNRARGDQCENCGRSLEPHELIDPVSELTGSRPELRDTVHWYMDLNAFAPLLQRWLSSRMVRSNQTEEQFGADTSYSGLPVTTEAAFEFPWRPHVVNFALGQIKEGLPRRAMTRDLTWGVPVPLDDPDAKGKCLFVWFDAPIGYVSFTAVDAIRRGEEEDEYRHWWHDPECSIVNFIGEDNIVFHALTWPAMLLATHGPASALGDLSPDQLPGTGYQLASVVCANAYLNFGDGKFSKTQINQALQEAPDAPETQRLVSCLIEEYLKRLEPDPLRYYLTAVAPESARTNFNWDDFFAANNGELVNNLGNFVNRYQKILTEHFGRKVPHYEPPIRANETDDFLAEASVATKEVGLLIERFEFKRALERIMKFSTTCNQYITDRAPWNRVNPKKELTDKFGKVVKKVGELDLKHAAETINACLQATRTLGTMLTPILPHTGQRIRQMLNLTEDVWTWPKASARMPDEHPIADAPLLFDKLDAALVFAPAASKPA